ncbi:hypothetical protein NDU88_007120 [Pleurodeles waltl]|uniref:Uncharacterized protein n=1 Tax=Pleurodeles waltl TaxID=8319 RepID=A0AAV7SRH3_PLEWA|nr:hypothetical protein NDU88_007120 [Pleurodeles waltl]
MPQSGSPRDSHLPKCSRAILHALWPGAHHASPKLRGQRSVRAVGHHGHDHPRLARPRVRYFPPQGRPSRGPARSAGVCRCSKWVSATPEAPSARHSVPHAGSAPQQGSRQPGPRQAQGLRSFLLTCEGGAGGPARTPGRRHTVLRGLGNTRLSTNSPAATPRQEGGRPVSPAAVGWLSLKRRVVPRPAAYPLTRSVRLPTLTRRQAQGRGARRPPPTGSARLALGSTGARSPTRVHELAPRHFAPGGGPG